ncbi:alpha/beta hydrolase [Zoogloea sp. LCSB751]|uniref:alpha/beta hydrolase n=1 Tax=Zoogloea sp. LCSB751 TaxID=1965277 RepID=UPI001C1F773D|nr:alpha/beta hydrolase [Zoogloea sp. LCSB751]
MMRFDKNGNPVFDSVLSPESFAPRALCILPKRHAIPVIFVPGIMGSNLRATAKYDAKQPPAWRPPNGTAEGIGEWFYRCRQDAAARQRQLTPEHCEVDPTGPIELSDSTYTLDESEARRRGWGELHWESYGEILLTLEKVLNDQYESSPDGQPSRLMPVWELAKTLRYPAGQKDKDGNPLPTDALKRWNKVAGGDCPPLTDDEIARLDDYYYPVWACGYNWLESNADSAKRLVQRIQDVLKHYNHPDCQFIPEGRVILVTHSMGGLVARRAAQLAEKDILGVVHGVQPVGGAPVVYRRFRAGTETKGPSDVLGAFAAEVLGWSAADITCVMANSPGPLELLPNKHYPAGWLRFERHSGELRETLMPPLPTPGGDPYEQIYSVRVQDKWWGMVDEKLIDPAGLIEKTKITAFSSYANALKEVQRFHEKNLGLYFHPRTYAYFGSDKDQVSYGAVLWVTQDRLLPDIRDKLIDQKAKSWEDSGSAVLGEGANGIRMCLIRAEAPRDSDGENAGDVTVPRASGELVKGDKDFVKCVFKMKGFDHQHSYSNAEVQHAASYCIGRIVISAKPVRELPQMKGNSCLESSPSCSLGFSQ